jgi:hypothetical protein
LPLLATLLALLPTLALLATLTLLPAALLPLLALSLTLLSLSLLTLALLALFPLPLLTSLTLLALALLALLSLLPSLTLLALALLALTSLLTGLSLLPLLAVPVIAGLAQALAHAIVDGRESPHEVAGLIERPLRSLRRIGARPHTAGDSRELGAQRVEVRLDLLLHVVRVLARRTVHGLARERDAIVDPRAADVRRGIPHARRRAGLLGARVAGHAIEVALECRDVTRHGVLALVDLLLLLGGSALAHLAHVLRHLALLLGEFLRATRGVLHAIRRGRLTTLLEQATRLVELLRRGAATAPLAA